MSLNIITYPNDVLAKPAELVASFCSELRRLTKQMFATMYLANGIGLAAPQVGISRRLVVIDISSGKDPEAKLVLVNPLVVDATGRRMVVEGCLSVPGFKERVQRPRSVTVRAQNLAGEYFEVTGEDLLAQCLAHEIDHLNGELYLDHLPEARQNVVRKQVLRQINETYCS